ncbi:MAG: AAA domain-containing protein [Corallococcus sp.]|nr:AAA domain-containing protein [Corallococcus sp.]
MNIKLNYYDDIKNKELLFAVTDGQVHHVKLTTNKLEIEPDRKDPRNIKNVRNVKMIFKIVGGGSLILLGNLGCDFNQPVGGMFFAKRIYIDEKVNFESIKGVEADISFSQSYPCRIEVMQEWLQEISQSSNFLFNLSQFDEFMELFQFYKTLSSELNNNASYEVVSISQPYYFVPIDVKEIETDDNDKIVNLNGVVIGYKIESYKYEMLASEMKEYVRELIDIKIHNDENDNILRKIRSFADNLYLNDKSEIDDSAMRMLNMFELLNIIKEKEFLVLSGEIAGDYSKCAYLILYDMGQKVKLESIDNSLRLINQGASGAAVDLLEYVIGSKPMPTMSKSRRILRGQQKYIDGLDDSQTEAFLMATDCSPVSLIKGPPGTGKTHVINAIVQYVTKELGERVIISSQTHVAIDNVLDKLMENFDLIIPNRITNRRNKYSGNEIDVTLYKTWAKKFSQHNQRASNRPLAKDIENDINNFKGEKRFIFSMSVDLADYKVLGATTTTSAIGGKKGLELLEGYDWLIIDEVSKCPITEVLRYLPYVNKIIMVGDDYQLAPLLEFTKEEVENLPSFDEDKFEKLKAMYEQSVFAKTLEKARNAHRLVELNVNYRSVESVLNTYNVFYDGKLKNMRERVRPSKVTFSSSIPAFNAYDVFFVDVKNGKEAKENTSRYNIQELEATADVLRDILQNVENSEKVSCSAIFPYAAQIEKFQRKFLYLINEAKKKFKSFEIDTVDAFQGRETDIVLVNTVVTDSSQRNFLNDFRRINVSMSRARDKLFIFGNPQTLSKIEMKVSCGQKRRYFAEIISGINANKGLKIEYNGEMKYESANKSKIKIC